MPKTNLNPNEIDELILSYSSAKMKLKYQMSKIDEAISELENLKSKGAAKKPPSKTPRKAPAKSRSRKVSAKVDRREGNSHTTAKPKKRVRKVTSGGYKLSFWDDFLISTIGDAGRPLINSELLAACTTMAEEKKLDLNENQIQGKIARCLHKLSNKRNILRKLNIKGRGYAYGMSGWFFAKSGKLKKAYNKNLDTIA